MKNYSLDSKNSYAFMLFELFVYIVLLSFANLLFFSASNKALLNILSINKAQAFELELAVATDFLRRDLLSASMLEKDWNEQCFVFKKLSLTSTNKSQVSDVCWYIGKLGLMRAEGHFDFIQKKWQNKSVSLVCKKIIKIGVHLQKKSKQGIVQCIFVDLLKCGDSSTGNLAVVVRPRMRML